MLIANLMTPATRLTQNHSFSFAKDWIAPLMLINGKGNTYLSTDLDNIGFELRLS